MAQVKVKPSDPLTLTITLSGVIGSDLTTVAGREMVRERMLARATSQIEEFLESVTVVE